MDAQVRWHKEKKSSASDGLWTPTYSFMSLAPYHCATATTALDVSLTKLVSYLFFEFPNLLQLVLDGQRRLGGSAILQTLLQVLNLEQTETTKNSLKIWTLWTKLLFFGDFFLFSLLRSDFGFFTFREMARPLTRSTHARLSTGGRRCDVGDVGDAATAARACADRPTLASRSRWLVR